MVLSSMGSCDLRTKEETFVFTLYTQREESIRFMTPQTICMFEFKNALSVKNLLPDHSGVIF